MCAESTLYVAGAANDAPAVKAVVVAMSTARENNFMRNSSETDLPIFNNRRVVWKREKSESVSECWSAACAFRLPASLRELLDQTIAMISLDLDTSGVDCAPGAAFFLELSGERFQFRSRQSQAADDSHTFTFAALSLAAHAHRAIRGGFPGSAFLADAFTDGAQTVGTTFADVCRVHDAAAVAR